MKKLSIVFACMLLILLTGCQSVRVERVDANTAIDLSGYWNDTDIRIVAETLVKDCVNAPAIENYIRNERMLPVVIVGSFRNDTDEHIDTSILTKKFEAALINSGRVDFVASSSERQEIREERLEQQEWASEETAKRLANEYGADFMLIGRRGVCHKHERQRQRHIHLCYGSEDMHCLTATFHQHSQRQVNVALCLIL